MQILWKYDIVKNNKNIGIILLFNFRFVLFLIWTFRSISDEFLPGFDFSRSVCFMYYFKILIGTLTGQSKLNCTRTGWIQRLKPFAEVAALTFIVLNSLTLECPFWSSLASTSKYQQYPKVHQWFQHKLQGSRL